MSRRVGAGSTAALATRRAALSALIGGLIVLVYLYAGGADPEHRHVMAAVTVATLMLPALVLGVALRLSARWTRTWPAALVSYAHLLGSVTLAHLDGGAGSVLGFVVLPSLGLVAVVMSRRRLVVFGVVAIGSYLMMAALGEPARPGYVPVYTLSFLMLAVVSAQHAEALRRVRRRLAQIADVDPLTGCLNRGAFDERALAEVSRSARSGDPVSLVLVDLDRFKQVNDAHGHAAGDDVLRWVGRVLRDAVRPQDVVGRIGGDEFAVLLSGGVEPGVADRLREALTARASASVGYATWSAAPGAEVRPSEVTEDLKHRADENLYADKWSRIDRPARAMTVSAGAGAGAGADAGADATADPGTGPDLPPAVPARAGDVVPALLRSRLVLDGEDRWRLAVVQMAGVGVLSFAIGLWYVVAYHGGPRSPGMLWPVLAGLALSVACVVGADRIARLRHRRVALFTFDAVVVVACVLVLVQDGGVESPMVFGLLNTIPLAALGASWRVSVPVIGGLTAAYGAVAVAMGVSDGWLVVAHLASFLALAASYAAHAGNAARQRRRLHEVSRSDALTGCLNRRGLDARFAAALSRAERRGTPVSLVVIDLDGFKAVNDTDGHRAGDELLRWVGARLRAECRAFDAVGRMGGDEFAVVLPDTDEAGAAQLAARLKDALRDRCACSVGTATYERGDDAEAMYLRADRRMYAEKARGGGGGVTAPTASF